MKYMTQELRKRLQAIWDADIATLPVSWKLLFKILPKENMEREEYERRVELLLSHEIKIEIERLEIKELTRYLLEASAIEDADLDLGVSLFDQICKHPGKSDLIYYSNDFFDEEYPSVDDVVNLAMNFTREV
jgi:hypothetical protein